MNTRASEMRDPDDLETIGSFDYRVCIGTTRYGEASRGADERDYRGLVAHFSPTVISGVSIAASTSTMHLGVLKGMSPYLHLLSDLKLDHGTGNEPGTAGGDHERRSGTCRAKKRLEPKILGDEEYVLIEWASVRWRIAETAVNSPSGVSSSSVRVAEITPLKVLLSHLPLAFCTMMRAWIF